MSEHGAELQTYNQELVKCLEDLKQRRSQVQSIINVHQQKKEEIEKAMKHLQEKLNVLNGNLESHIRLRDSYDSTITETENGFKKILETSQTLLNSVQLESSRLDKFESKQTHLHN